MYLTTLQAAPQIVMKPLARFVPALAFLLVLLIGRPCFGGNWYVGNTAAGEWIQYDKVWLTAGSYRFTANAGSPAAGALFHLEVDGVIVNSSVPVPNTGRVDSFAYVNLGNVTLSQGYHTLRIVFETSGASLDWFMLRKDTDTTTTVKPSDVAMDRPSTRGMLISPIVSFNQQSEHNSIFTANDASYILSYLPEKDSLGNFYSDYQLRNWYRVPMFEDFDRRTDRYWDIMVGQLMTSRAQVPLIHCRSTKDFTHDLQDRGYVRGDGSFEGRWLKKFVEAVSRNPQAASSLQIGMFLEDGPLGDGYFSVYGVYPAWGDSALADYTMQYWLQPWLDQVPASMLYQPFPNSPIINVWTGHPTNMVQDGLMGTFLTNIRSRMQARYGFSPVFLVSPDADASAQSVAWGVMPWYTWGGSLYTSHSFNGINWGFSSSGSRKRLDTVWLNDWNPATNTGTACNPGTGLCDSSGVDNYQSPLDSSGNSTLLSLYSQATSAGTQVIQEEGFFNIPEGSPIFGSYAPGWNFPNQHLAATRQFADVNTNSLKFEAEDADEYDKATVHTNLGGTYRNQWYSNTGLDVYQPESNLNPWNAQSAGPGNLVSLSAGFFDVWALDTNGQIWAHGIADGTADSTWQTVSMPTGVASISQLAMGKHFAWALSGNSVYTAELPYGSPSNSISNGWTSISGTMVNLAVDESNVWALDASGKIYYMPVDQAYLLANAQPAGSWTNVTGPGPAVNRVYAGGNSKFIWVMSGSNIYYSPTPGILAGSAPTWTQVANPYNLTQLSIGSQEVWGVNAAGSIYRRSISGVGGWDAVDGTMTQIAVGENYAWALSGSTPSSRRLTGFLGAPTASVPSAPGSVTVTTGNASALLNWGVSSGAASYRVKRAPVSGGPYTTVVNSTASSALATTASGTDIGLTNGTSYYYVVTAVNGVGESANSAEVSVTPTASGTPPAAPTGLTATGGAASISLSWNAASGGATSYNVKRSTVFGGPYTTIATGVGSTSYIDANVAADTPYYYVVSAANAAGESFANSALASASATGIPLNRTSWVASASANFGNAPLAIDGNISTRWDTAGPQSPGQWFQVDMGSAQSFYKLILDATPSPNDYPRGYQVNVSSDGVNWGSPIASGIGTAAVTTIIFRTQTARYFRITQTGSAGNYWSMHELNAYAQPMSPDFSVSGSPSSQTVVQGNSTTYTTTITALNGFTSTVDLSVSGLPSGATGSFNPTSVAGSGNSTLTVSTSSTTPTGTYTLTIMGTSGSLTHSTAVTLVVNAPPLDFSVSGSPSSQTVVQGNSTTYTTTITALNGFTSTVNLSVSGLPSGATGSFNPTSVAGSGNSTLTVSTSSTTPTGTYTLTITGTSGSLTHSTTVTLVVNAIVLLSQGHPTSASSQSSVPSNGNDGSLTTRWAASDGTYPQWWMVDLGNTHSLSQVVIYWYKSSSRAYQYRIETSNDNVTFTTAVDQTARTSTGNSTDNFSATGRYVRITVTGVIGGGWASFWEGKVYGTP